MSHTDAVKVGDVNDALEKMDESPAVTPSAHSKVAVRNPLLGAFVFFAILSAIVIVLVSSPWPKEKHVVYYWGPDFNAVSKAGPSDRRMKTCDGQVGTAKLGLYPQYHNDLVTTNTGIVANISGHVNVTVLKKKGLADGTSYHYNFSFCDIKNGYFVAGADCALKDKTGKWAVFEGSF